MKITRQLRWRREKKSLGLCVQCGNTPATALAVMCNNCGIKSRIRSRTKKGCKPKKESGPGRPSVYSCK